MAPNALLPKVQKLVARASTYEVKSMREMWQFEGILRQCGVRALSGTFLDGNEGKMKVELYNYCNGTDAEVAERGLVECDVVARGVGPKAPAKGAGTKYVAQVQQNQAEIGSKVEYWRSTMRKRKPSWKQCASNLRKWKPRSDTQVNGGACAARELCGGRSNVQCKRVI